MKDNKGRTITAVYAITMDAAYCIYDVDPYGEFVETAYTWCGKWTRKAKNRLEYDNDGRAYFRKFKHILYLQDFMRIID